MIKQLRFDYSKIFFQKKYWVMMIALIFASIVYSYLGLQKELSVAEVTKKAILSFRPICWLLCCYVICDVISGDYHYKSLKTSLPSAQSRNCYIASKVSVSLSIGFLIFMTLVLSTNLAGFVFSMNHLWIIEGDSYIQLSFGVLAGLFCLVSIFFLCMIITENEAITIGFSMGTMMLMMILESFESVTGYLPTMWLIILPQALYSNRELINIGILILLAFVFLYITMKQFNKKDLFI